MLKRQRLCYSRPNLPRHQTLQSSFLYRHWTTEKVCDLGVILDKNLTLTHHINETFRKETNTIRSICKYLTNENLNALVISPVDYCNSIFYGLPKQELDKLQREFKTLKHILLPELNDTITSNLLLGNYTSCQLNHI